MEAHINMGSNCSRRTNRLALSATVEIVSKEYAMNHKDVKCVKSKINGQKWEVYYTQLYKPKNRS